MPISFLCAACGKSANVSEKFAGRKVKCKCGTVGMVPRPAPKPDADLLDVDLDAVQFEAVAPAKIQRPQVSNQAQPLTKRQREDKALAEKLGQDWKAGPKSEYVQVNDEEKGWFGGAWGVIKSGPVPAFYGYLMGSVMVIFGMHMLIWFSEDSFSSPVGRRLRRIPMFFISFGGFTLCAGLVMFFKGLSKPEMREDLTKTSISMMIGVAVAMMVVTIASLIWLIVREY